ncbi:helix-turn-helix transcriptional regulator [Dolosigranulum pigrum]|uniref:helix-turn-helix transcriptional regulator n=1 Tax=Dolosigranulum pigrum TaxID=29394 RepID=UPI000DBF5AA8|nr:helix-turn-helix transcriptional regulator [Dolosigranulum pigrum]RAN59838.1 transcriptional regulator [Dolosigranulum pigrum]
MTTGYRIKEIRDKKGITQQELADKANVSRSIISELETGRRTVSKTDTLFRIAKALDVPFRDIFLP